MDPSRPKRRAVTSNEKSTVEDLKKIVLYESMSDTQRIERDERQKRRKARRERTTGLHNEQNPRENDHEENPPASVHDR